MGLNEYVKRAHDTAKEKGWYDLKPERTLGDLLTLITSELSEAYEEYRNGKDLNEIYYNDGSKKPEGFPIEIADTVIRIFDLCGRYGIDLDNAINIKSEYNKTRPYRHGNKVA